MTVYQDVSIDLSDAVREALGDVDDTIALLDGIGWAAGGRGFMGGSLDDDFVAEVAGGLEDGVIDELEQFVARLKAAAGKAS